MITKFKIDGLVFDVTVKKFGRNFNVLDTKNTNRTLDGVMHRDVIGTYYNYSLELETSNLNYEQYNQLYEIISSPDESHDVSFPYANSFYNFKAYITNGSDEVVKITDDWILWGNLKFNIIAMSPKRRA